MGISGGMNIAAQALNAYQISMQTMGHNIANANTPGYSRQQATLVANEPTFLPFGALGTGVRVADIRRTRDAYLDVQLNREQGNLGRWQQLEDALQKIELYLNEPSDAGVNSLQNEFWNGWHAVVNNPADMTARVALLQRTGQLTDTLNDIDAKLNQLRLSIDQAVKEKVTAINSIGSQIATINEQIISIEAGGQVANDLRDQRDLLTRDLGQLVDFTAHEQQNSALAVFIDGEALVWNTEVTPLVAQRNYSDPLAVHDIRWSTDDKRVTVSGGEVGGMLQARDTVIPAYRAKFDAFASGIITQINRAHADGVGLGGFSQIAADNAVVDTAAALDSTAAGLPWPVSSGAFTINLRDAGGIRSVAITVTAGVTTLENLRDAINTGVTAAGGGMTAAITDNKLTLSQDSVADTFAFSGDSSGALAALGLNTFFSGRDAASISVRAGLAANPNLIAAGQVNPGSDVDFNPGDNSNARAILSLREQPLVGGTISFENYYNAEVVGALGVAAGESQRMRENQQLIVEQIRDRIEEKTGVSVDEEMALLIQYQRAYTAAARYMVIVGQTLDELVRIL